MILMDFYSWHKYETKCSNLNCSNNDFVRPTACLTTSIYIDTQNLCVRDVNKNGGENEKKE